MLRTQAARLGEEDLERRIPNVGDRFGRVGTPGEVERLALAERVLGSPISPIVKTSRPSTPGPVTDNEASFDPSGDQY